MSFNLLAFVIGGKNNGGEENNQQYNLRVMSSLFWV